eukprot:TRINITY_DN78810_c0_g1_i1.p1 TRINITY_DN78810_c0_g1~~TRINITY_DN78810_c0_g1_i1.p1  ORF type:complete len:492 (-),score=69.82 TRINITY_DN78810_c0_g1_i1:109-1530(-)
MLRCRSGHQLEKVKKLKPWQGHIHIRECVLCRNEIDRHETHWSCPERCRYDICQFCYKSEVAKRKAKAAAQNRPSGNSMPSGSGVSSQSRRTDDVSNLKLPTPMLTTDSVSSRTPSVDGDYRRRNSAGRHGLQQAGAVVRSASQQFLESSWQQAVELCFWIAVLFAGDLGGAVHLSDLVNDQELQFPYPCLTACFANAVAGFVMFALVMLMTRTGLDETLGELACEAEVDLRMTIGLGLLVTFQLAALVRVLTNPHHTMAAWIYMTCPVVTMVVAGSNYLRMEVLDKRLLLASGVASVGGMMAVQGAWPALEGLSALKWAVLAVALSVGRWLLTQKLMSPSEGSRPGTFRVAKDILLAGAMGGLELSVVYEWSGTWGVFWLPHLGSVMSSICIIGLCNALSVVAHTRIIQITSASFAAFLVPFQTVTLVPLQSFGAVSLVNWIGLALAAVSGVMYFKARKDMAELPEGYLAII